MVLDENQIINDGRVLGYSVQGLPGATQILEFDNATKTFKWVLNAAGDVTDASNEGAGEGLFIADVLGILQFKSLTNSADILLTGTADELEIALSVAFLARMTAIDAAVALNTAKVTNATHTSEVTGSGALVVDKTAISNKTLVTALAGDHVLIGDASDSDNLKKVNASDFLGGSISESDPLEINGVTKTLGEWILSGLG